MNRAFIALLLYLGLIFAGGATISPWLYKAVTALAQDHSAWVSLSQKPFHRYVSRSMMFFAVLGLFPLAKVFGFKGVSDLGWHRNVLWRRELASGLTLAFFTLGLLAGISLLFQARGISPDFGLPRVFGVLAQAAATAIVVSLLEETLFRGFLQNGLRIWLGGATALILSSLVYALVHFFQRVSYSGPVGWDTGFFVLGQMFGGFGPGAQLLPAFLNLTLTGMALGLMLNRTGRLYSSFGLHAGWIFWIKMFGVVTVPNDSRFGWFWGSDKLIDGWAAAVVLAILLLVLFKRTQGDEVFGPKRGETVPSQ